MLRYRSARRFLIPLVLLALSGCSTAPLEVGEPSEPVFRHDRLVEEDVESPLDVYDPWEGFNRTMYKFNAKFDEYVFLPAVGAYQTVVPEVGQTGISNFFKNLEDLMSFINLVLQFKGEAAMETFSRIGWNTTVGLFGFIDVATAFEVTRHEEDFGQTLGFYGVGHGPYLVLPILGPSNLRDTTGLVVDSYIFGEIDPLSLEGRPLRQVAYYLFRSLDKRSRTAFRYYETGSPFEYDLIRMLYTTKRDMDIAK